MKKNFSSKINQLVLRGLLAEDSDLFLQRLDVLLSRSNSSFLNQLAEGVILSVKVADNDAAIKNIQELNKCNKWKITEITQLDIMEDGRVRVSYKYLGSTRWFATEEQAERFSQGYSVSGSEKQDDEHPFMGRYASNSSDTVDIKDWMEVEML